MSGQRPGDKVVHQDYIARIRYSNALPPPPNPPKLLDIPGTGLAGGQYTSAGYASRLARDQPLNIEADAELGMPIDLIGIPGIFDGDERGESRVRLWDQNDISNIGKQSWRALDRKHCILPTRSSLHHLIRSANPTQPLARYRSCEEQSTHHHSRHNISRRPLQKISCA